MIRRLVAALALAVAACTPQLATAQSLPTLPRALTTTGVNDSALFLVSDSARRTRAVSGAQLKLLFAGGGGSADSIVLKNGTAAAPSLKFTNSTGLGLYRYGADTLGFGAAGVSSHQWNRQGIVKIASGMGAQTCGTPALGIFPGTGGGTFANTGIVLDSSQASGRVRICDGGTTAMNFVASSVTIGSGNGLRLPNGSAASPTLTFSNSTGTGLYRFGADTLGFATAGRLAFAVRDSQVLAQQGRAGRPAYSFTGLPNIGMSALPGDTLTFSTGGFTSLKLTGSANPNIIGGAGNMTIQAGTGNSRRLALQTTTSAGAATDAVRFNELQQTLLATAGGGKPSLAFAADTNRGWSRGVNSSWTFDDAGVQLIVMGGTANDQVQFNRFGTAAAPSVSIGGADNGFFVNSDGLSADTVFLTTNGTMRLGVADIAATAAGDVNLCITTGKIVRSGATCGTSSAKAKTAFGSIFNPVAKTMALRPVAYNYIPGMYEGRHEYGLVADSTAAVDSTLAFYSPTDSKLPNGQTIKAGDALNVNDRAVLALLIATVQQQQRQIDSLRVEVRRKP